MALNFRPTEASPSGGLQLIDDMNSRSVVSEILKSVGKKILSGHFFDLMHISRPASISYPMTYLEAACEDFSYCSYLKQASLTSDPVYRIQLVCAFIISGLHKNPMEFKNKPPLNPILGETFAASLDDGTEIWLEQTSHHPPRTHWYMKGPDNLYVFHGHGQIMAGLSGPNTIRASKQGKNVIVFKNGDILEYTPPNMVIFGIVFGQRIVNFEGNFSVVDRTNFLTADITFEQTGLLSKVLFFRKKNIVPTDFFNVNVRRSACGETQNVCSGRGSWLEFLEFNTEKIWSINMKGGTWKTSQESLPSDSKYRHDLQLLIQGNIMAAQRAKDYLENLQRADKKLRI